MSWVWSKDKATQSAQYHTCQEQLISLPQIFLLLWAPSIVQGELGTHDVSYMSKVLDGLLGDIKVVHRFAQECVHSVKVFWWGSSDFLITLSLEQKYPCHFCYSRRPKCIHDQSKLFCLLTALLITLQDRQHSLYWEHSLQIKAQLDGVAWLK